MKTLLAIWALIFPFFNHIFVLMSILLFSDDCRQLEFMPDYNYDGKRLKKHVIHTADVIVEGSCRTLCYMEPNCVSYNFKTTASENGRHHCELNNATHEGGKHNKLVKEKDFFYRGAKVSEFWRYSSVPYKPWIWLNDYIWGRDTMGFRKSFFLVTSSLWWKKKRKSKTISLQHVAWNFACLNLCAIKRRQLVNQKFSMSHAATKILQCTRRGMCPIHVR